MHCLAKDRLDCCASPMIGTTQYFLDVRCVELIAKHNGMRGPERYRPVSSVGKLDTGEPYCVYRFVLFWDGFEIRSGKSASGEGIYMLCLNMSAKSRASPNAIRVISLTPPGMGADVVLRRISEDILQGTTHGFVDYDATGVRQRIFLDLVGFLGDTPRN